jgi:ankyrin repeat protein
MTPLHLAAEKGHAAVAGALLAAGADKDAKDQVRRER